MDACAWLGKKEEANCLYKKIKSKHKFEKKLRINDLNSFFIKYLNINKGSGIKKGTVNFTIKPKKFVVYISFKVREEFFVQRIKCWFCKELKKTIKVTF